MNPTFKSIQQEQISKRLHQRYKFNYSYQVEGIIAPASTQPVFLTITQGEDFMIEKITGSVFGPTTSLGVPSPAGATDFPMPGTTTGFAGRGLSVQIVDTGASRDLTNGFIPLETMLTPGYGVQLFQPYTLKYFARRNSRLRFDFRNQDTQANAYQSVTIVLNGFKYQMPEPRMDLEPTSDLMERQAA